MLELHREYLEFLNDEVKALKQEIIDLVELPDYKVIRARLRKDIRDTKTMLDMYENITTTNERIREVKRDIRITLKDIKDKLGFNYEDRRD